MGFNYHKSINLVGNVKKDKKPSFTVPIIVYGILTFIFVIIGIVYIALSQIMNPPGILFLAFPLSMFFFALTIHYFVCYIVRRIQVKKDEKKHYQFEHQKQEPNSIEASCDEMNKDFVKYDESHFSVSDNSIISPESSAVDIGDKNIEQKPVATTYTSSPIRYVVNHYYYTKVVGVTYNGIQSILPQLHEGMPVQFIREPNNPFDRNAIGIWCNGKKIGHLSADEAASIAPQMDRGIPYDGEISQITGGKGKTYGCEISVNVYKPSISGLTSQVEHIDESNPIFKKTCVLFGYDNFAAYNVAQSIANLGGFTRQRISGKTDFAIVNKEQPDYELEYTLAKVESYKAEGKKVEIMYSDKLEEIKKAYLNS